MMNPSSQKRERLVVIQCNLRHAKSATALLDGWLATQSEALALIQEPYVRQGQVHGYSQSIKVMSFGTRPRAAILSKGINLFACPSISGPDSITAIGIEANGRKWYVNSTYMDQNILEIPAGTEEAMVLAKNNPCIIATDSNAHSHQWGHRDCVRGAMVEEFISKHGLIICNKGKEYTFMSSKGSSCIDLTLANLKALPSVTDWKVSNDPYLDSDHLPITFYTGCPKPGPLV